MTVERVLDGYPLLYHLATVDAASNTLSGRSGARANVAMSIFGDTQNAASGVPVAQVNLSGMYVNSLTYTIPTEGNCTESVSLVGNDKTWLSAAYTFSGSLFDNADTPLALDSGNGGVQRRQNVVFGQLTETLLPGGTNGIPGISSSGTNNKTVDVYGAHVQNVTFSVDLGREALNELGRRGPFFRFVTFPVEVTTEIEVLSTTGDQIEATEAGVLADGNNLSAHTIQVKLEDSTLFYLGTQNKLSSVTSGGGDTGGGNDTNSYSYTTFNDLTITQDQNPGVNN